MALRDEQADILGGPILQRPESGVFSEHRLVFKSATLLALGLLVWIACARGLERLKRHRELRYRKAMRRKHGIPDSDCRPFAVAYAAAKRAHHEREAQDRRKSDNYASGHDSPAADQRTNAQKDACLLRKRAPETTVQLHLSGKHATVNNNKRPEVHALDFADRNSSNLRRRMVIPEPLLVENAPIRPTGRKRPIINHDNEESKKRSFEDESTVEHETVKKTRLNGSERIDGDEHADWYAQYSDKSSGRASKESLGLGNDVDMNGRENVLRNEGHECDEAMEGVVEDEVTGLRVVARGKKRDRAEAGSTFGGDDEEDAQDGRASHHRKRRTIFRGIELPARRQKRDREAESFDSEGEEVESETSARRAQRSSKKKRGKKAASDEVGVVSLEDPCVSKDPLCGGRRVGDLWEADGVQYKVGDKGERLRLTLVKKARNKYHMPQDSQHPDRSAALEIYVEMWMTEEQYKQAEGGHGVAWQETSRESSEPKVPDVDFPTKNGKNLLWDSVKCSPARRPFRQLVPPNALTRINPFEQSQSQPILGRRVASSSTVISPILPSVADSPTRPGLRGFSKWEKQDREAEAMTRIRAKIEEQKRAQAQHQIPASVTAPELGKKPLSVPTITLTPAPAEAAEAKLDDNTPQRSSKLSFATPPSTFDPIEDTASLSSTSVPAAILSPVLPSAPAATSSQNSLSPFSFVKPPQVPLSNSPATPSSTMPNIFGKGTDASTPPSAVPLPSTIGVMTQSQPPSTESISKPVSFSFAKPGDSSSSSGVIAPPIAKTQQPLFHTTSGPSSSSVNFGSTPAAIKGETHVHPSNSTTVPESLKLTAPLFSFSGASSSSSTTIHSTPSVSPVPKFSFGQPSATSAFVPSSNLVPGSVSQPKPTFKFGQPSPDPKDDASAVPIADESKKLAAQVPTFGTPPALNAARPSPFGIVAGFGTSSIGSPSASGANLFGKPASVDGDFSTLKPTLAPPGATAADVTTSSTSAWAPASGNTPAFSFGGTNSMSAEGSKPVSLLGGVAKGSGSTPMFSANPTESKPSFKFGASESTSADIRNPSPMSGGHVESPRPSSILGNTVESSKPAFAFGGSSETPKLMFGGAVGSKSTSTFSGAAETKATSGPATESTKPFINTGSVPIQGSTTFGALASASPFTLGKNDNVAINASTSTSMQTKPATFTFGAPVSTTGSKFGQPSNLATSGDSIQPMFGKPANATPSAFGFAGTSTSSTFAFNKPAGQNQQQEQ